jgi:hypothetical protein
LKTEGLVVPAKAGTHVVKKNWAPAFAGATTVFACLLLCAPAVAQGKAPEKPKNERMEKKKGPVARKKATPEQIRRFNDLEKKQK